MEMNPGRDAVSEGSARHPNGMIHIWEACKGGWKPRGWRVGWGIRSYRVSLKVRRGGWDKTPTIPIP